MKHYIDVVMVQGSQGVLQPAIGASVQVLVNSSQLPASIFVDDAGTPGTNPTFTDSTGRFGFYIPDGRYDLIVTGAGFAPFTASNVEIADVTEVNSADQDWSANSLLLTATVFANLGTPANGKLVFCSDCTTANPCAGAGTGALAKRLNGVWVCN